MGLAVTIGVAPRPSIRIENTGNHTLLAQSIIKVAAREGASRIIVGFPLEKNGTEGVMSDTVRVFSQTLADDWHVSAWGSKFNDGEWVVVQFPSLLKRKIYCLSLGDGLHSIK